jgi:predicted transglutaminase-like cysteine proteinase
MEHMAILILTACIGFVLCTPTVGSAAHPWMGSGTPVVSPKGFTQFCTGQHQDVSLCGPVADHGKVAAMMPSLLASLTAFNRSVNGNIRYGSDIDLFGTQDLWVVAAQVGDCEDYALAKRKALIAAGWPPSSVWLAMGDIVSPTGGLDREAHVVMILRSDHGDYVLDSLHDRVELWHASNIRWFIHQVPGDAANWRVIIAAQ